VKSYLIHVVDDEPVARKGIALALRKKYRTKIFSTAEAAIASMARETPDMILLDIGLPGMSGIEALEQIRQQYPEMLVIMITAYEDIEMVVSAVKSGAYNYVVKPIQMDTLMIIVQNALETIRMKKEIQLLRERHLRENLPCFIGESHAILDIMAIVKKVAQSRDTAVLIAGETGTGKELIAEAIHHQSPNLKGPLLSVNCGAIPENLIESELFGYEKGAFTGADTSGKMGLVESAEGGTLFLDEVGDLSMDAQVKLLRFLEEGEYYRLGGSRKRQVRTRVVSATNKDLMHMVEQGLFRQDLYYRLAVVKIEIPSLNQRREDILPMARHFLVDLSQKYGKFFTGISYGTENILEKFHWKGNARELRNLIERGVLLSNGPELDLESFFSEDSYPNALSGGPEKQMQLPAMSPSGMDFPMLVKSVETHYFKESLKIAKNNESKAARLLQLSRDTFRYRRKKLGIYV